MISCLAFGMSGTLAKGLMETGWSPLATVGVRVSGAALLLGLPALWVMRRRLSVLRAHAGLIVGYGMLAVAATQLCYFLAVQTLPVAQPRLDEAKALDTRIATLAPQHAAARQAAQAAEARQAEADSHLRHTRSELERLQRDLAAARDWLHAHPHERPLGEAWSRWDAAFAQAARLAGQLAAAAAQRTGLTAARWHWSIA